MGSPFNKINQSKLIDLKSHFSIEKVQKSFVFSIKVQLKKGSFLFALNCKIKIKIVQICDA